VHSRTSRQGTLVWTLNLSTCSLGLAFDLTAPGGESRRSLIKGEILGISTSTFIIAQQYRIALLTPSC